MHLIIVIVCVAALAIIAILSVINERKYPSCPKCNGNLNTRRKLFSKVAHCSKHGDFIPR